MTQFSYPAPPQAPPPRPAKDSRAIWGVVGGMIGLVLGIGLMTPAVVANVPTDAAPTETVSTASASPTEAPASPTEAPASPTEAPAETPAKVPHGHRAAAEKAESLLDIFHYSDAELRDELDDRGFTPEEIDYAISQLD